MPPIFTDYADLQINAYGTPGLGFSRTNAANARIQGLEIESTFRPTSNLELFGNIGWLDAEYVDLTLQQAGILTASGASCAEGMVTVACAVGLDMKNAPEFKSNAGFLWIRDGMMVSSLLARMRPMRRSHSHSLPIIPARL